LIRTLLPSEFTHPPVPGKVGSQKVKQIF